MIVESLRASGVYRTARFARTAAFVWGLYNVPPYVRRRLGRPEKKDSPRTNERAAEAILAMALELRGVNIKLCQVLAARSDRFPPEFVRVLKQCHDAAPARSFDIVREVVERELGAPLQSLFSSFDELPLASASLAQVHRATLRDGRECAVKVQYPDIAAKVAIDLANMRRICRVYERIDPQPMELSPLLSELADHLALELDFRREVENADRVRDIFAADPRVLVPAAFREHCTRRVITMELVSGIKVTDVGALRAAGIEPRDVIQSLMSVYVRMIMAAGFFHADPHPGNLFVRPRPGGEKGQTVEQVVLMDFGLCKSLPDGFGMGLFELMFSMMTMNESAMIRAFRELGFATETDDPATFVELAKRMMRRSGTGRFEGELTEEMTDELFEAVRENPIVRIPEHFVLVGRVFALLSGIAHTLGHRADILAAMGVG